MKHYYRNKEGKFCTTAQWFKENANAYTFTPAYNLTIHFDYHNIEDKLEHLAKLKQIVNLSILGCANFNFETNRSDYVSLKIYPSGMITIYNFKASFETKQDIVDWCIKQIDKLLTEGYKVLKQKDCNYIEGKEYTPF